MARIFTLIFLKLFYGAIKIKNNKLLLKAVLLARCINTSSSIMHTSRTYFTCVVGIPGWEYAYDAWIHNIMIYFVCILRARS